MKPKVIRFENLYNVDFCVDISRAFVKNWEENTFGVNRYWNLKRVREGILYFENCDAVLQVKNGITLEIKRGELVYIPSKINYGIKLINCDDGYCIRLIDYRITDCDGTRLICSENPMKLHPNLINTFLLHHEKLFKIMHKEQSFYLKLNTIVSEFLTDVILMYRDDVSNEIQYKYISKAISYIEQNYTKSISNKYLADLCAISPDCFIRGFKKYYGVTPRRYVIDLRLNRAKDLLVNNSMTISEIAYESGFESTPYFCKVFKEKVGLTPNQYRNYKM